MLAIYLAESLRKREPLEMDGARAMRGLMVGKPDRSAEDGGATVMEWMLTPTARLVQTSPGDTLLGTAWDKLQKTHQ